MVSRIFFFFDQKSWVWSIKKKVNFFFGENLTTSIVILWTCPGSKDD